MKSEKFLQLKLVTTVTHLLEFLQKFSAVDVLFGSATMRWFDSSLSNHLQNFHGIDNNNSQL